MPDEAAHAVIRRFWGDNLEAINAPASNMMPVERYMQFRRLNSQGWRRIIARHGPQGARQYRDAMRELGKGLGLEE